MHLIQSSQSPDHRRRRLVRRFAVGPVVLGIGVLASLALAVAIMVLTLKDASGKLPLQSSPMHPEISTWRYSDQAWLYAFHRRAQDAD